MNKAVIIGNGVPLLLFLGLVYLISIWTIPFFGLLFLAFIPSGLFEMFEYYNKRHYNIAVAIFLVLGMLISAIYFSITTSDKIIAIILGNAIIFGTLGTLMFFLASIFPKMLRWDQRSLINKGKDFRNQKKYQESIKCFFEAIATDPTFDRAWYEKGITLLNMGEFQEAEKCFKKNRDTTSHFKISKWSYKCLDLLERGYFEASQGYIDVCIEKKPKSPRSLIRKSIILINLKKYDESIIVCDKIIVNGDILESAWNIKALALAKLGKLDEAFESVEKSLEFGNEFSDVLHTKAYILSKMKRYPEALEYYDKSIQTKGRLKWYHKLNELNMRILTQGKAERWFDKGKLLQEIGKNEEALECFNEVLKIFDLDISKPWLLEALKTNQDFESARKVLES